ncbi:hypothetical protein EJB05_36119, partial [Eragrostis curvula]
MVSLAVFPFKKKKQRETSFAAPGPSLATSSHKENSTPVQYWLHPWVGRMQKTKRKQMCTDRCRLNTKQNPWTRYGSGNLHKPSESSLSAFEVGLPNLIEPCETSLSELRKRIASRLSESVVAVASFVGGTKLFECTGIFIENVCPDATTTSVLTSANICGSPDHVITENLMIKVRLPSGRVVSGWIHHYDSKCGIAVVNIRRARGFQTSHLSSSSRVQIESSSKVLSVGRCFDSGMLKSGDGIVIGSARNELYEFMSSTYEGNKAWTGSPILDFDGNFAGLNICIGESTAVLPTNKILECLGHFETSRAGIIQGGSGTEEARKSQKHTVPNSLLEYFREFARRDGYPLPTMISHDMERMRVINSYEEEFEMNIWLTLTDGIAATMRVCVVPLASFNGDARCFACTGVFIGCYSTRILTSASLVRTGDGNKIDKNLQVIAVGCLFKQRKLMASNGVLADRRSKLDCKELRISTCRITKAGIGGPLIHNCGNFIGMNFFHDEETPYLPREKIQELLENADAKGHGVDEAIYNDGSNSWPVPKPVWYYPPWIQPEDDLMTFD